MNTDRPNCLRDQDLQCPGRDCPGRTDSAVCDHLKALQVWRRMTIEDQTERIGTPQAAVDPVVRDAVNACPSRGPVLPISLQDDCGCRGKELSECREGRGAIPGRVTLRDCLNCRGG
jgi:hypothetical protein